MGLHWFEMTLNKTIIFENRYCAIVQFCFLRWQHLLSVLFIAQAINKRINVNVYLVPTIVLATSNSHSAAGFF